MPLRAPAGRGGRPWLLRRLDVAHRAADVLEEKRRALLRRRHELAARRDEAGAAWDAAARSAAEWHDRARVLSGARRQQLAVFHGRGRATVRLRWRNELGVVYPESVDVALPDPVDVGALGGSAALARSAEAHRDAVVAAARYATARAAHDRVAAELAMTARRLRAIERRWIPQHEAALAGLEVALDEAEREDATRARWVRRRSAGR